MDNQLALVTGGAGFIGSDLVRQLVQRGFRVRVVDNLANGKRENLEEVIGSGVELNVADVRDQASMSSLIQGVNVIFHLACSGFRHSIDSPAENHQVNATATLGLLKIARDSGVDRFVFVSSSEVYGPVRQIPVAEDHPTMPLTVYGASKLAGEAYTRAFWETYRYPTVVVRPFSSYGPRCHDDSDNVIPRFMQRCIAGQPMIVFGDGTQTRDLSYVGDTAAGILAAGVSSDCIGQTINLGSGKEIQIRELARIVAHVLDKDDAEITHVDPRPGEVLRLLADNSKAKKILGIEPAIHLKDGLARLRDWYSSQGLTAAELQKQEAERTSEPRNVPSHV